MSVEELNKEQKIILKGRLLDERLNETEGRGASYGELAMADELITDEDLFAEYSGVDFVEEDF